MWSCWPLHDVQMSTSCPDLTVKDAVFVEPARKIVATVVFLHLLICQSTALRIKVLMQRRHRCPSRSHDAADFGADVIKIERPGRGDSAHTFPMPGTEPRVEITCGRWTGATNAASRSTCRRRKA